MGELVHTSRVRLVRDQGPHRLAYIEHFSEPFHYGVHSGIANFYGVQPAEEHPATLDHMIAAVGG